jgi:ATP-dependent DNA helicase RecQ
MVYIKKEYAEMLLKHALGEDKQFRPDQWEAIDFIVNKKQKVLLVQSTGWGKSLVYYLSTKLLREQGYGPTILISPLLSLIRNQMEFAKKLNLFAVTINSENTEDWREIEESIRNNKCDVLLISPERLGNERFLETVLPYIKNSIGLFVVDEAHCISDWGHDFRPDYRRIIRVIKLMPPGVPLLATTATANNRVVTDIIEQVDSDLVLLRGPLTRKSLRLKTMFLLNQAERLAWLADNVPKLPGSGIIYCLTKKDCELVASFLRKKGINVEAYHSKIQKNSLRDRSKLEEQLLNNKIKALVATVALGMGFDKPDIGFVIHYQRPGSLIHYYQQVGRAGRNIDEAYAILLSGKEDDDIAEYFIKSAFPLESEMESVLHVLENSEDGCTLSGICVEVNLHKGKISQCIKHLTIEGAVTRDKYSDKYYRTPKPWKQDIEKVKKITALRYNELDEIKRFMFTNECLMQLVCKKLDDPHAVKCGKCANCDMDFLTGDIDQKTVIEAVEFIKKICHPIKPRVKWYDLTSIPKDKINKYGLALCIYGDAGWGVMVQEDKYIRNYFREDLVKRTAEMVITWMNPLPEGLWVAAIPSLRRPELVPNFARRLAAELKIEYHDVINKVIDTPQQKEMKNSELQYRNVMNAFKVSGCPTGPVLLIDDVIDSRWTLTICGYKLKESGSGPVYPVTLAIATESGDT